jgi:hypothetical protein
MTPHDAGCFRLPWAPRRSRTPAMRRAYDISDGQPASSGPAHERADASYRGRKALNHGSGTAYNSRFLLPR